MTSASTSISGTQLPGPTRSALHLEAGAEVATEPWRSAGTLELELANLTDQNARRSHAGVPRVGLLTSCRSALGDFEGMKFDLDEVQRRLRRRAPRDDARPGSRIRNEQGRALSFRVRQPRVGPGERRVEIWLDGAAAVLDAVERERLTPGRAGEAALPLSGSSRSTATKLRVAAGMLVTGRRMKPSQRVFEARRAELSSDRGNARVSPRSFIDSGRRVSSVRPGAVTRTRLFGTNTGPAAALPRARGVRLRTWRHGRGPSVLRRPPSRRVGTVRA
jgi:hypothetical protein